VKMHLFGTRASRNTLLFFFGVTLLVQDGMGSEEAAMTEESGAEEEESCESQMQVHTDRVKEYNAGTFEIPSVPPGKIKF